VRDANDRARDDPAEAPFPPAVDLPSVPLPGGLRLVLPAQEGGDVERRDRLEFGARTHVVCAAFARGGEVIREIACNPAKPNCHFPDFPGTVPWKIGLQAHRDAPVDNAPKVAKTSPPAPVRPAPAATSPRPAAARNTAIAPAKPAAAPVARTPRRTPPAPATGPAVIRVESLPTGAQIFVDGRSVGFAPVVVSDLMPGTHSIRMELPGHRPWVNAVTLGPGARERVAASLEQ